MIAGLAQRITNHLCVKGEITEEESELYNYGLFLLISKSIFFVVAILAGTVFHAIIESILFYITYTILRNYAGGYHAPTERSCSIMSTGALFISIGIIGKLKEVMQLPQIIIATIVLAIAIYLLSPMDTEAKRLTDAEKIYYHRITGWILLAFLTGILAAVWMKWHGIYAAVLAAMALETALLLIGKGSRKLKMR